MKRAELEGKAVAYALLIMRGRHDEAVKLNHDIIAEHGDKALIRIKKRAWQHVQANSPAPRSTTPGGDK